MKTKRLIIGACCLVFTSFSTVTYAEEFPVQVDWANEKGDRSISSCPTLVKEGNSIIILSDKFLENLSVTITSQDGSNVFLETGNVTVDMEYSIPIDMLPAGNYCITVRQGKNYIIGYFHVG